MSVKYNIPVTLIAFKDGIGKASCRSVKGISVFNIFQKMSEKLVRFGGHDLAAGFIVKSENLEEVKNIFKTSIENIKIEKEKKSLKIDAEYSIENIDEDMFETMESISPYGLENPHPLFIDRDLSFENIKKFGVDERHFNGIIRKNGKNYHMVAFDLGHKINEIESKIQKFDIVYYPEKTLYRGEEIFQIRIKDIKIKDDFYEIFTK
ncbi:ssDNA exonuclease RecJ [Fusobacterium varium]|nr:ssDNA exonuclease RecJ [Fusobacterium varium]